MTTRPMPLVPAEPAGPGEESTRPGEMAPASSRDALLLTRYTGFIRRQWLIMAIGLALGLALGMLRSMFLVDPAYTATVAVLAPPVPLHSGLQTGSALGSPIESATKRRPKDTTMDTETQLVHSEEVLGRLGTFAGFRVGRDELRERITMRVPVNTRVLTILVEAGTPAAARDGADIVAEAYLTLREQILGGIQQRNREGLQRRQDLLRQQLESMPGDPAELIRLTVRTRRQAITREISEVQRQLSALDGTAIQPGEVVRGASLPGMTDDPGREVSRTSGAGLGLLAGIVVALLRNRRPRRLRSAGEIRGSLSLPVLAEVTEKGTPDTDDAAWRHACRRLRNLVHEEGAQRILMTGVPVGDAVRLAHGLATVCTEGGTAVAVLQIGSRRDGAAREHAAEPYLVVAIGDEEEDRVIAAALASVRRRADVIITTGVPLGGADAVASAIRADLTVLSLDVVQAVDRELTEGIQALAKVSATPRGLVLITPGQIQSRRRRTLARTPA